MAIYMPLDVHARPKITFGYAPTLAAGVDVGERPGREPVGGGYCPCSGVTDFYTDAAREEWEQMHAFCDDGWPM